MIGPDPETSSADQRGLSRRAILRGLAAGAGVAAIPGGLLATVDTAAAATPIVKPLPPEWFTVFGTNAETKWEALRGTGFHTPVEKFFVRNHTATPTVDADTWRLRVHGSGLRGAPTKERAVRFSLRELRALPSESVSAFIECAGNGRSFFTSQQGQAVTGTAWKLGAVGVARWRGVRLSRVLRAAGLSPSAVDVMPVGLDADFVSNGENLGPVRRPLPVAKALDDVLLAYEMNGRPLPPDHGFPVRLVVPGWIGIASIKWVGELEVSATPLVSPWNTQYYRFFGPGYPPAGSAPLTRQVVKSAFELGWGATLPAGRPVTLTGRSWSGNGRIAHVEVSTDGGATWRRAQLHDAGADPRAWRRWSLPWRPAQAGPHELLARATDRTGATQPDVTSLNTAGYLFGAVVRHPVTIG